MKHITLILKGLISISSVVHWSINIILKDVQQGVVVIFSRH